MPEPTTPPAAGGLPPPRQMQQPPMGVSSATGPTPNRGFEAAAMQRLGLILKMATDALPLAGATSEVGQTLLKVINMLSKHAQPGDSSMASERNAIDQMAMKNAQQTQTNQALRQQQMQAPDQGAGMGAAA